MVLVKFFYLFSNGSSLSEVAINLAMSVTAQACFQPKTLASCLKHSFWSRLSWEMQLISLGHVAERTILPHCT